MAKIKIFIVDDSLTIIKILKKILSFSNDFEVTGTAYNGKEAIKKIPQAKPDAVILDLHMPELDGIGVIKYLIRNHPVPILVFSAFSQKEAAITQEALIEGALDFLTKPKNISEISSIQDELFKKLRIISNVRVIRTVDIPKLSKYKKAVPPVQIQNSSNKIIVIGISTGGPRTLHFLLANIPENISCPIVIAQHMPPKFTKLLAEQLSKVSPIPVKEVQNKEKIQKAIVYIGQGGKNCIVNNDHSFSVISGSEEALPSANVLLTSAAEVYKENTIGLVLTGMGKDGLKGAGAIKDNNGIIIAESEKSAMIYGMPKAVVDADLADYVSDLKDIPKVLKRIMI